MRGPSTTKLLITGTGILTGLGSIALGVALGQLQPIFFAGVAILGLPFLAATLIAVMDRVRLGPLVVPSMPSTPAFDPDLTALPSPTRPMFARQPIRAPGAGRRSYRITTRLPY